jgi:chemotaxis protein CheD
MNAAFDLARSTDWTRHQIVVPMGGMAVTADPEAVLATYALGSCVAVVLYDPARRLGGMLHYQLPSGATDPNKAASHPAMFADTGVPMLFEAMYRLGSSKGALVVKLAGGAQIAEGPQAHHIGPRNLITVRKMFWKVGVLTAAEDVGGELSRTVRLHVSTGAAVVLSRGQERPL